MRSGVRRWASATLCGWVLAAAAIGLTFSPHGGVALAFLAFAPLGARLSRSGSPFLEGCVVAALAHGVGLHWMVPALAWRTDWAIPIYLLVLVLIGLLGGTACGAAVALHRLKRWPLALSLAACWTGFEWFLAHLPGLSYSWLNAGASLAWHPGVSAVAEVLGARALTFWTVVTGTLAGVAFQDWLDARRGGAPRRSGRRLMRHPLARPLLVAGLVAGPWALGEWRLQTLVTSDRVIRVAAVQAGHGHGGAGGEGAVDRDALGVWRDSLAGVEARFGAFDVVVFPEVYLGAPLWDRDKGAPTEAGRAVTDLAHRLGRPVLMGARDLEVARGARRPGTPAAAADTAWYNAAFLVGPDGGSPEVTRKQRLVPGMEGTPRWPLAPFGLQDRGGYVSGRESRSLPLNQGRIGVMICYDAAYGKVARDLVRDGAEWLVVISNDDWLDPQRPFTLTWAYWQHATQSRLRAIENRMGLVQVSTTGHTFSVSPLGVGRRSLIEPGRRGTAVAVVRGPGPETWFTRWGDVAGLMCAVVLVCGVVLGRRART